MYIPEDNNKAKLQWLIRTENDEEAAKQLLQNDPNNEDLKFLYHNTALKQKALELFLQREHSNIDLCFLIICTDQKQPAWEELQKRKPANDELRYLVETFTYSTEAGAMLTSRQKRQPFYLNVFLVNCRPKRLKCLRSFQQSINWLSLY